MIDVETGREVLIRKSLSQESLPMSFRYYDFIFNFIQNRMSFDRRQFFGLKKAMAIYFKGESKYEALLKKFGLGSIQ